jgi:hypothetical protein
MAVFRIEKTRDYTVMANFHLRDITLSLKAKGLLSLMLSLPEDWDYTTKGLARICKLLHRHFSLGEFLGMTGGFHLLQELGKGFSEFLFGQLTAIHYQSHDLLFHFFLHRDSTPFRKFAGKWVRGTRVGPPNDVTELYLS